MQLGTVMNEGHCPTLPLEMFKRCNNFVLQKFQGIRVQVRSVYIEGRSQPSKGQYFFAYRIRITNNSDRPVQLLRRHWIITDANGRTGNVWGIGVIGEQPVILPNTGFEYSSACPLSTPSGRMEGDFEMKHIDKVGSKTFNVAIAPFSLSTLEDDTDTFGEVNCDAVLEKE
ncbi:Protein ApaG like [Actinidia chinensis var. chinensis]|uniref:Protein ApaG like n=1 Tax=Actinidia chinensis var. chinensis TaxID=1590841 RepID=A0A2R6PVC1_ACTCC|nr:Protein ApaG like [Actinidia chinensis var. chinensis]